MKYTFKILSLMLAFLCAGLFCTAQYAKINIKNEYRTVEGQSVKTENPIFEIVKNSSSQEAAVNAFGFFPVKKAKIKTEKRKYVTVGGEVFGIKLYTKGVLIVGSDDIETERGKINPAVRAGLRAGDIILKINGKSVSRNNDIASNVKENGQRVMELLIERDGKLIETQLLPQLDKNDRTYKAGLWVRDSSAGIGTVTFYDKNNMTFACLGHPVCDVDTGKRLIISGGEAVSAEVKGCYRGEKGEAGELCGAFTDEKIGNLKDNTDRGIYGELSIIPQKRDYPVALEQEIKLGPAQIISTVDLNGAQYYSAEIIKIYKNSESRNLLIKITDRDLIKKTGGIVQGMSGSPVIQDGKIVGAVTHVLVSDPTQGYGIFLENMMKTAENAK